MRSSSRLLTEPFSLHVVESGTYLVGFQQFSALGRCITFGNLRSDFGMMLG